MIECNIAWEWEEEEMHRPTKQTKNNKSLTPSNWYQQWKLYKCGIVFMSEHARVNVCVSVYRIQIYGDAQFVWRIYEFADTIS